MFPFFLPKSRPRGCLGPLSGSPWTSVNATAFIASYRTTHFAQIVKAPIRWNGDPLVSRAGESAKVIVDVTAAAGQLRSLPAVLLRE
jgi:hypothetical protein